MCSVEGTPIEKYSIVDIDLVLYLMVAEEDKSKYFEVLEMCDSVGSLGTSRNIQTAYKIFDKGVKDLKKRFRVKPKKDTREGA